MSYFVGALVEWAGGATPLPPGFVRVTLPIENLSNVTPVVQIMYVGQEAAECVSAALEMARYDERMVCASIAKLEGYACRGDDFSPEHVGERIHDAILSRTNPPEAPSP